MKFKTISSPTYLLEVAHFLASGIYPDLKNSKKMAAYLEAGGLGLPERDYYLKTTRNRKRHARNIRSTSPICSSLLASLRQKQNLTAVTVLALETQTGEKNAQQRRPEKSQPEKYNPRTVCRTIKNGSFGRLEKIFFRFKSK